jgi:hypothetical protein
MTSVGGMAPLSRAACHQRVRLMLALLARLGHMIAPRGVIDLNH